MRERRRLALAERQLMLAKIARREAIAALANTLGEEVRSASLAKRSRDLAQDYSGAARIVSGAALRVSAQFAGALQTIAKEADQACKDAQQQAAWQAETLAGADNRAQRLEERAEAERRELRRAQEKREAAVPMRAPAAMARKLQSQPRHPETLSDTLPAPKTSRRLR